MLARVLPLPTMYVIFTITNILTTFVGFTMPCPLQLPLANGHAHIELLSDGKEELHLVGDLLEQARKELEGKTEDSDIEDDVSDREPVPAGDVL
ncbi:hypothetical protein BDQ17DRAFT_1377547 [Cyathus striatus]|nr:hypothetical protein BDQ17DRAFT_1377547 [Cyathus striatus]